MACLLKANPNQIVQHMAVSREANLFHAENVTLNNKPTTQILQMFLHIQRFWVRKQISSLQFLLTFHPLMWRSEDLNVSINLTELALKKPWKDAFLVRQQKVVPGAILTGFRGFLQLQAAWSAAHEHLLPLTPEHPLFCGVWCVCV